MNLSKRTIDRLIGIINLIILGLILYLIFNLTFFQISARILPWILYIISTILMLITVVVTAYLGIMLLLFPPERKINSNEIYRKAEKIKGSRAMISPGRVIILSGLDGSGKSSHLDWIRKSIEMAGKETKYVNLRWASIFSYPLFGLARLLGYAPRKFSSRANVHLIHHRYEDFSLMKWLWPPLYVVDMWINAYFKVIRPMKKGKTVICDRYVVDGIVDVSSMLDSPQMMDNNFSAWLLMLLPPHAENIIIDIDIESAFQRKLDVPSIEFLEKREHLFRYMARKLSLPLVDGNRNFSEVQKDIARILTLEPPKL
jgi:thymidylate kinase